MAEGWIKIHRQFLGWEWYKDSNMVSLFILLLLKANYTAKEDNGLVIERGALLTSLSQLVKDSGLTIQKVRTCLRKLQQTGEIVCQSIRELTQESTQKLTQESTQKPTYNYTKITICNYAIYQTSEYDVNTISNTSSNTSSNIRTNIHIEEDKEDIRKEKPPKGGKKKRAELFSIPSLDEVRDWIEQKGYRVDAEAFIAFYESKGWKVGTAPMKSWKAALVTWHKRENRHITPKSNNDETYNDNDDTTAAQQRARNLRQHIVARLEYGGTDDPDLTGCY